MKNFPKFLTKKIAQRAVGFVVSAVFKEFPELKRSGDLHVTILVPVMVTDESDGSVYPSKYKVEAGVLYEESFGDSSKWELKFDEIAQCKALQTWLGINPGGMTTGTPAHLLFPDFTPFHGGDSMEGIVVACSAKQWWFDKMIARMVLSVLIGLARDAWETSNEKAEGIAFLAYQ